MAFCRLLLLFFCYAVLITAIPLDDFYPYGYDKDEGVKAIVDIVEVQFGQEIVDVCMLVRIT